MMLEKTLESPLDCKEIKPVNPKGDQSWVFIGRTDAEAETPMFWPPHVKNWLIWKQPVSGKDWRQEEKGMRGWGSWMASPARWTWVWASSGSWWWIGRPGVLQSVGSQRVRHDWETEVSWTEGIWLWRTVGFDYELPQDSRKHSWRAHTHKILCIPRPRGKQQWPHRRLSHTYLVSEPLLWRCGWSVACCGDRDAGTSSAGRRIGISPFWKSPVALLYSL